MSSRYPPQRERSPPRHFDRRPSATYTPAASTYRGTGDPQAPSNDRAPPRGPKADFRGASYQFSPAQRGRGGFPSRAGDTWDRDRERERDVRNQPPPYRREEEPRDWPRRDRDFPPSDRNVGFPRDRGYVGRDRSASPDRPRRNSKENVPSTFTRPADSTSSYYGPAPRGGSVRGRGGRADWDRSRGRSSFVSERDREFFPRSRSREDWRERDYDRGRIAGPDAERNDRFDRREYDRPDERDTRARDHDVWPRDRSPVRNDTGRPASPGAVSTVSQHGERYKAEYETARKPSLVTPLTARSEGRRENDADYFSSRTEPPRRDGPLSQPYQTPSLPQSASLGLDYGPPPSVAAATPSVQEKPPPPKPQSQPPKTEPQAAVAASTSSTILQPPSGPKADRLGAPLNAPSTPRAATQSFEQWPKADPTSRSSRPSALNTVPPPAETNWKMAESFTEPRTPAVSVGDRPLPANIPSGPRAASGSFRTRLLSNEQAAPNAPPTAPRQPKANAIESRPVPNAPTGPRSSTFPAPTAPHITPPTGPQAGSNRQWVNPDYRPTKPSIMNQMNKPYQHDVRERSSISGPSMRPGGVTYQSQQSRPKITQPLVSESASQVLISRAMGQSGDTASGTQSPMDEELVDSPADVEMSYPASDEDDVEDDLDEDYFATSEETHQREMKLLESKKPAAPFTDPITAGLIIRIQLLSMIVHDITPEAYENLKASVDSSMDLDEAPTNAPLSPERTPEEKSEPTLKHPRPRGIPLSQSAINPIPTPPIDELPYLKHAMEDCHVFDESEDETDGDATPMLLRVRFEREAWDDVANLENLHTFYKTQYPIWRRDVEQAEQRLREVHRPSPAPASPAPSATPSLPPGPERPGGERTRGARNTTDLDMQQAILMSQQSAKEEEERREREAASNALPNYETEAKVPSMLKPSELVFSHFEDTNSMVNHDMALDVYRFVPPEDDFTEEEQAAFIIAYCQNPKKWGKIAASIPGRSYQDCIIHYYLTKDKANYKEHWRRSQPKRGRRRAANVKPRANNLMSDLALNEDGEGPPVAVTDSGRPRRAAAPTFGDAPETDAAAAAPQAKRLKENGKDIDGAQPKPRGRKGAGAGKGRKAKDKVLLDPTGQVLLPAGSVEASPQKLDRNMIAKEKNGRVSLKAEAAPKLEGYGVPIMSTQLPIDISKVNHTDVSLNNTGPVPVQVTSYWSVPEQQKFPLLVQYFGRDFAAIAQFLKTKSPIMIKNYYMREVNNGKQELEAFANVADEKRARGEQMGPPPTPVQPPKRRYEATPSMAAVPRTVMTANEQLISEIDPAGQASKAIMEDFASSNVQRIGGELLTKPRAPREVLHHSPISSHVHPKVEEPMRAERTSLLQKSLSGPPRGLFQDEPLSYAPKPQGQMQASSPQQRPIQGGDHRSIEARAQPANQHVDMRGTEYGRGLLPHSREQIVQPQQAPMPQYQPMSDRSMQHTRLTSHSRHSSLLASHVGQSTHEQAAADLASLRNLDYTRGVPYSTAAAHSPMTVPVQPVPLNAESFASARAVAHVEPPKPAPAKRSNVFGLLNNDDPPEPAAKRTSLDGIKRNGINTPPPQSMSGQPSLMPSRQQDDLRSAKPYSHVGRSDPGMRQDFRQDFSSSPAPGHPTDQWLDKFDPRPGQNSNPRAAQPSPAPGPYSVVPPSSHPSPAATLTGRYDPTRNSDSGTHRRSLLGIDHAPSPPPHQQQQSAHLHRSSSGSSQHGRVNSTTFQQPPGSGPPSYPHSTVSTPVSGIQHRSQQSIDRSRQTIQQYMNERRDIEMLQQHVIPPQPQMTQQPPSQPPSRVSDRREMFSSNPEPRPNHSVQPPTSQTPQPPSMSMGYSTAPPNRTYTPPHPAYSGSSGVGGHGHHGHQQQYQPHQGHQPHQSHQPQYSHSAPQGPSQHHQQYQGHPGYSQGPPPLQHQRNLHPMNSNNQPQPSHYRNYSADERR